MTPHEKRLQDDFHVRTINWANKWLDAPEASYPGKMTREKLFAVLEEHSAALEELRLGGVYSVDIDGRMKFAGYSRQY
jgi:hypothetical protein